jgi:Tol biopolymer transport system component
MDIVNRHKNGDERITDEIHLIEVATSRVVPLRLPESHRIIGFDWSPDGKHIVYSDFQGGYSNPQSDIYILSVDDLLQGENVTPINITNSEARNEAPEWSPQGDKIAFDSNRDGNFDIYVMNVDGTEVVNLTLDDKFNYHPLWSPEGERIVYQSRIDRDVHVQELYLVNIAEPGSRTSIAPSVGAFDWSPDGNQIALSTNESPDSLHIVDTHTGNVTDLTELIGDAINRDDIDWITGLDWSPCLS